MEDESQETDDIQLINHVLLTFKHSLYNCRDALTLPNFFYVRERLKQAQKIEYKIAKDRNVLDLHLKSGKNNSKILTVHLQLLDHPEVLNMFPSGVVYCCWRVSCDVALCGCRVV